MNLLRTLLSVGLIACSGIGCVEEFDTTRRPHREATLGDHVYEVLCNRLAISEDPHDVSGSSTRALCQGTAAPSAHTTPRLKTLHRNRARLVQALDATFGIDSTGTGAVQQDPELAADVRTLLDQMLPLYDDGLMARHNQSIAPWMEQLRDTSVADTLAAQSTRQWYSQSVVQNANDEFVVTTAALPILMRFDQLVQLGVAFDEVFGEGAPDAPVFQAWLAQVQATLRAYDPQQLSGFLLDYVLKADDDLGQTAQPLYSVLRNQHGDAEVAAPLRDNLTPASLPTAPFGDANTTASSSFSRDEYGRLKDADQFLYAYQDLNKTPLAAVLRQVQMWMGKLATLNTTQASPKLAGTEADAGATLLDGVAWLEAVLHNDNSASFDTNQLADPNADESPVLDAAAATGWLTTQEVAKAALPALQMLWEENETDVVAFIQLFANMGRRMDQNDLVNAALKPGNTLVDDMIDVAQKMAKHPGLFARVAEAMKDPRTAELGKLFKLQMSTRDFIDYDHSDLRSSKTTGDFSTLVDRTKPDIAGNESVFQRLLYLVHDSHHLTIANNSGEDALLHYAQGELFSIDDAALFYLRSIIGKARMSICARTIDVPTFEAAAQPYAGDEWGPVMPSPEKYGYRFLIEYMMGLSGLEPAKPSSAEIARCNSVVNPDDLDEEHMAFSFSVTPQAAARMLFIDPDEMDAFNDEQESLGKFTYRVAMPPCKMYDEPIIDGVPFRQLHGKTLFAWNLHGFHDAITPLLEAFAHPDAPDENGEGGNDGNEELFLELLEVLHKHWSTPQSDRTQNRDPNSYGTYAAQTGLSQFEPLMAFALYDPNNPELGVLDLTATLMRDFEEPLQDEDEYLDPVDGAEEGAVGGLLAAALGVTATPDPKTGDSYVDPNVLLGRPNPTLYATDGVTRIAHPSPAHVLNGLLHHMAKQTKNMEAGHPGMGSVFGALLDTFSEVDPTTGKLANRETYALVSGFLNYAKDNIGNMGKNLRGDAGDLLASPLMSTSLQMMTAFNRADPTAGRLVQSLVTHLVSDEQQPAVLNTLARTLYTAADARVDLRPLAEVTASALDYPEGALPMTLKLSSAVNKVDTRAALPRVIANLGRALPNPANTQLMTETPIDVFMDVYQQVNRVNPADNNTLSAADHTAIIDTLADFVQDAKGGFVRLLEVIRHRHGS